MIRSRPILICASAGLRASLIGQLALYAQLELIESEAPERALELLRSERIELLLVEAEVGAELPARARATGFRGPVLLICDAARRGRPALLGPPVEYVERPFRFADLLARIFAHLRRRDAAKGEIVVGAYRFRPGSRDLRAKAGRPLRLTEMEAAILSRLARANGQAVSREMLLRDVWGYSPAVVTRTLETHIYRLRRKIEPDPANARFLVTEGNGYRLIAREERSPPAEARRG
jgi:DNA-binding response OmpR family regulator